MRFQACKASTRSWRPYQCVVHQPIGGKLIALVDRHALPAIYHLRELVDDGGLMSYGASDTDAQRRDGRCVGCILMREKPSDFPESFLVRADELIE